MDHVLAGERIKLQEARARALSTGASYPCRCGDMSVWVARDRSICEPGRAMPLSQDARGEPPEPSRCWSFLGQLARERLHLYWHGFEVGAHSIPVGAIARDGAAVALERV